MSVETDAIQAEIDLLNARKTDTQTAATERKAQLQRQIGMVDKQTAVSINQFNVQISNKQKALDGLTEE